MDIKRRRQQGFTLIEIIAVIILLGVLAATVIPKFTDLTEDAKNSAAMQAVAEGIARVNSSAAAQILDAGGLPAAWDFTGLDTDAGDYTLAYGEATTANDQTTVAITATGAAGSQAAGSSATGTAYLPGAATAP